MAAHGGKKTRQEHQLQFNAMQRYAHQWTKHIWWEEYWKTAPLSVSTSKISIFDTRLLSFWVSLALSPLHKYATQCNKPKWRQCKSKCRNAMQQNFIQLFALIFLGNVLHCLPCLWLWLPHPCFVTLYSAGRKHFSYHNFWHRWKHWFPSSLLSKLLSTRKFCSKLRY